MFFFMSSSLFSSYFFVGQNLLRAKNVTGINTKKILHWPICLIINNLIKHILSWTDDKLLAAAAGNVSALFKLLEAAEDSLWADGKLLVTVDL